MLETQVWVCFSLGNVSFVYYIHKSFLTSFRGRIPEMVWTSWGKKSLCLLLATEAWVPFGLLLEVTFLLHKHENLWRNTRLSGKRKSGVPFLLSLDQDLGINISFRSNTLKSLILWAKTWGWCIDISYRNKGMDRSREKPWSVCQHPWLPLPEWWKWRAQPYPILRTPIP